MRRHLLGNEHPDVFMTLNSLAVLLKTKGDYDAAEPLYREAVALSRRSGEGSTAVAASLNNLARLLEAKRDYEAAEPRYRESLEMLRQLKGDQHPSVATISVNLANLLIHRGDLVEADRLLHEALEIFRNTFPSGHWRIVQAESVMALSWIQLGRHAEAETVLLEAYSALREQRGDRAPSTRDALDRLVVLYEALGPPPAGGRVPRSVAGIDFISAQELFHTKSAKRLDFPECPCIVPANSVGEHKMLSLRNRKPYTGPSFPSDFMRDAWACKVTCIHAMYGSAVKLDESGGGSTP